MKKKILNTDFIVELFLGLMTLGIVAFMVTGIILICILPINNYHHAIGFVEFKNQYKVVSQNDGAVTQVYAENYTFLEQGQPILQFRSESDSREVDALNVKLKFLENELATLQHLFQTGAVNGSEIDKKRLEIEEMATRKQSLKRNIIYAPVDGRVFYKILPEYLKGSFIEKGENFAFIYTNGEKHIRISFPNTFADRFKTGGSVLFKYKDPVSFKVQKMKGLIYKTFINEKDKTIELFCDVVEGKKNLVLFQPSTMVEAAIIINSTSICQDMFGIDLYPVFKKYIEQNPLYIRTKKICG